MHIPGSLPVRGPGCRSPAAGEQLRKGNPEGAAKILMEEYASIIVCRNCNATDDDPPGRAMQLSLRIFAPELRTGRPEARPLKKGPESGYYRFPYDCRSSSAMPQARSSTDKRQPAGGYSTNSRERTGSPNGMITRTSFPSHPHSYRHFLLSRETADTTSPAHTDNTACSKNRAARRTGRSRKRERNHTVSAPLPEIVSTAYLPSES